jgi:hypothetical protein
MDRTLQQIKAIHASPRIIGLGFGYAKATDRMVARVSAWDTEGNDGHGGGAWIVGEAPTLEGAWQAFLRLVPEDVLGGAPVSPTIHQKPAVTVPDFGALMKRG